MNSTLPLLEDPENKIEGLQYAKNTKDPHARNLSGKDERNNNGNKYDMDVSGHLSSSTHHDTYSSKYTPSGSQLQAYIEAKVKSILKPYYIDKKIDKEEYKEILRKSIPKICQSKSRNYNQYKIQHFVLAYLKKVTYCRRNEKKSYRNKPKYTPAYD